MEKKDPGRRAGTQQEEEHAATSCSSPGAQTQYVDTRSKQASPALTAIALAIQAPCDVLPALKRVTRDKLAEAIAAGDDEASERLRVRLYRLLNGEAAQ